MVSSVAQTAPKETSYWTDAEPQLAAIALSTLMVVVNKAKKEHVIIWAHTIATKLIWQCSEYI